MAKKKVAGILMVVMPVLGGCATLAPVPVSSGLEDTQWVLIGTKGSASDRELHEVPLYKYTMSLAASGTAQFKFDCNQGSSTWNAAPEEGGGGKISFGTVAVTAALCDDSGVGEKLAADVPGLSVFKLYDGTLTLTRDGSGTAYVWDTID